MKLYIQKILQKVKTSILKRTKRGYDVDGNKFKPYTPAYAKSKGSKKVNLTNTGQMLDSLDIKKDKLYMNNSFAANKLQ